MGCLLHVDARFDSARRAEHAERVLARTRHQTYTLDLPKLNIFFCLVGRAYPNFVWSTLKLRLPCSARRALPNQNQLAMTIGDPSIQSFSDIGAGRCMTQYFAENTQGTLYGQMKFI